MSCGIVVSIATGYGLDVRGVDVQVRVQNFHFSISSRPALGSTQPPIPGAGGGGGTFSGGKAGQGREADHAQTCVMQPT
jgi:hypothetical protein